MTQPVNFLFFAVIRQASLNLAAKQQVSLLFVMNDCLTGRIDPVKLR